MRAIVVASVLLLPLPAFAQGWTTDQRSGCKVVNAHPQLHETVSWSGGCKDGFAEGRGVLQWAESGRPTERYEGEMRAGEYSGQGDLTPGNGGHYVGEFLHGKANGMGTLTTAEGTLAGTWVNDCYRENGRRAWVGADPASCYKATTATAAPSH